MVKFSFLVRPSSLNEQKKRNNSQAGAYTSSSPRKVGLNPKALALCTPGCAQPHSEGAGAQLADRLLPSTSDDYRRESSKI